jgi:hypothetical protein
MRFTFLLPLVLCLAACHHGLQNNEAVRQGVIDHFTKTNLNVAAMDISVTSVQFNGNTAEAAVSVTLKGGPSGTPMAFKYHMEQKDNKWVVVGPTSSSHATDAAPAANPHDGSAMPPAAPGSENPHAGGGAASMPSPQDLPPAKKK